MKNVSLLKVTFMVVVAALASNLVNADDDVQKTIEHAKPIIVPQIQFSELIEELDSDKNGMLSEEEVSVTQSKVLQEEFKKMDTNEDSQIDEAEYNSYLAEVKDKSFEVAKSII